MDREHSTVYDQYYALEDAMTSLRSARKEMQKTFPDYYGDIDMLLDEMQKDFEDLERQIEEIERKESTIDRYQFEYDTM